MWKSITGLFICLKQRVLDHAKRVVKFVKDLSRPARVAAHAARDVTKTKVELVADNALLRQQLIAAKRQVHRPRMSKPEKLAMTMWSRLTRWWQSAILFVQPDTVLRWHRDVFRFVWWRKSRPNGTKSKTRIAIEIIVLIREMARDNRTWGAERR